MGNIDLDPASCAMANRTVKAGDFFSAEEDGLQHDWWGRVWLNPPYGTGLVVPFVQKLVGEITSGRVKQACVLVNNGTETVWAQLLLRHCQAVCFLSGRVKFLDLDGEPRRSPLQGQALFYFGPQSPCFCNEYQEAGTILIPTKRPCTGCHNLTAGEKCPGRSHCKNGKEIS
jgi:ParB family chromosome partitioning protein